MAKPLQCILFTLQATHCCIISHFYPFLFNRRHLSNNPFPLHSSYFYLRWDCPTFSSVHKVGRSVLLCTNIFVSLKRHGSQQGTPPTTFHRVFACFFIHFSILSKHSTKAHKSSSLIRFFIVFKYNLQFMHFPCQRQLPWSLLH